MHARVFARKHTYLRSPRTPADKLHQHILARVHACTLPPSPHTGTPMRTSMSMYMDMDIHVHAHEHPCAHRCPCPCTCTWISMYMHTNTRAYMSAPRYTGAQNDISPQHTHARKNARSLSHTDLCASACATTRYEDPLTGRCLTASQQ